MTERPIQPHPFRPWWLQQIIDERLNNKKEQDE